MEAKPGSRTLEINGEEVTFEIEVAGNVATVKEGGRIPTPRPFLGYTVVRDGKVTREGVLTNEVRYPGTVAEQFSDDQLRTLYQKTLDRR